MDFSAPGSSAVVPGLRDTRAPPWRGDLRVGGGYSIGTNYDSPHRLQRFPQTPRRTVGEVVSEFQCRGVTALEVTQGGATLWTGESDGSLNVRNGFTGDIATNGLPDSDVTIPPTGDGNICYRLFATDTHMWAGFSDGGVRVYDHLVIVQVWPDQGNDEKPHKNSVEHFCQLYDGSVLSGDIECNLIRWSKDEPEPADGGQPGGGPFQKLVRRPHRGPAEDTTREPDDSDKHWPKSLSAMDASGPYVYIGDRTGQVHVLDADTLAILHGWDTGHGCVTAVKFMDGLLFTGGSDRCVRIWRFAYQDVPEGSVREPVKVVHLGDEDGAGDDGGAATAGGATGGVQRFLPDHNAHVIWAVDHGGRSTKLHTREPYTMLDGAPQPAYGHFKDIAATTTWDACRIWSTGSTNNNYSWFAQWSRAEEHMREAVEGMKSIIDQDSQELDKWRKLVGEFSKIDARRKEMLARSLEATTSRGMRHIYFRKWLLWYRRMVEVHKRQAIADCMYRNSELGLRTIYWGRLMAHWQHNRMLHQKRAMCANIMATTTKGLRRVYWRKIDDYRHKAKKDQLKRQLGESLLATTELGVSRKYLYKILRYVQRQKSQSKRMKYAAVLMRSTESGLRRIYYFRLARYGQSAAKNRRRHAIGNALAANTTRGLQRLYYRKFNQWGEMNRHQRQKRDLAESLRRCTQRGLLATYQAKCDLWLEDYRHKHMQETLDRRRKELKDKEADAKSRMERCKKLMELRERKKKLEGLKDQLERELNGLRGEHSKLEQEKADKLASQSELKRKALTLDDAMARLKEMALNFDGDYEQIQKVADRELSRQAISASGGGAARQGAASPLCSAFLGAHMGVKAEIVKLSASTVHEENIWPADRATMRAIIQDKEAGGSAWIQSMVDLEGSAELKNPPWNLDGRFTKIQKFQYNLIGASIKTLVILFDMMSKGDKDQITTDEEIIINAENLMHLCENSQRTKEGRKVKEFHDSAWTKPPEGWTPWTDTGDEVPAALRDQSLVDYWKQLWSDYQKAKVLDRSGQSPGGPPADDTF